MLTENHGMSTLSGQKRELKVISLKIQFTENTDAGLPGQGPVTSALRASRLNIDEKGASKKWDLGTR